MFLSIGQPKQLNELVNTTTSTRALRPKLKVLIIDDAPFLLRDVLTSHGFSIHEVRDLPAVEMAVDYPIIACDIKGVGASFKSKHEGAHLFAEIRKAYPEKYILAFTGFTFDATYNEFFRVADMSLTKDADTEIWVRVLDDAVRIMSEPKERWLRIRRFLLEEMKCDLWSVFQLEQGFIRAVLDKDRGKFSKVADSVVSSDDIRGMLASFSQSLFADVLITVASSAITAT